MSAIQLNDYQEIQDWVVGINSYAGETTIEVKAAAIVQVCEILKEKFDFNYLADITAIDYYVDGDRFGVAYNLVSLAGKKRLRILARLPEHEPTL